LKDVHVLAAVAAGAVAYAATLALLGGFRGLFRIELVRSGRAW
jgi:hypothetical protein